MQDNTISRHTVMSGNLKTQIRNVAVSVAVMAFLVLIVYFFKIPNPNMILIAGLAVFTSMYGYAAGTASGIVMMIYSMFFFSTDNSFIVFTEENLQKTAVVFIGVVLSVAFIGRLKKRQNEDNRKLQELNSMLVRDNMNLEQMTMNDDLTGIRNRHALRLVFDQLKGRYLHVMMIDMDCFKETNDRFGHEVGDTILRTAGGILREIFGGDCCFRYGGDEFLIICPDVDHKCFVDRLSNMRERMDRCIMNGYSYPMRASSGFVYGESDNAADLRLMIRQADRNMYRAKHKSKGAIVGEEFSRSGAKAISMVV